MTKKLDLVQIIRDNPGCTATVDNDCWWLKDADGNKLADDSCVKMIGDGGYGSGPSYGGDLLQALAVIVGVKISSV